MAEKKAEKQEEAKAAKDAKPAAAAPAQGSKKNRLVMIAAVITLLGSGGGGAWWYTQRDTDSAAEPAKAKTAPTLPPVFVALDSFTVNLQPEAVGSQYLQIGITLKIAGQVMADKLKEQMPEVRSSLLLALSAKRASELLLPEGKIKLAQELLMAVMQILDPSAGKKPTAAPINVAATTTDTQTDATETAEGEPAEDSATTTTAGTAEATAGDPAAGPVLSVLFTAFIIQ